MSMWWASVVNAILGALFAKSAIRLSLVETLSGPDVPGIFPSSGSIPPVSPFLRGVLLERVPPPRRSYETLRHLAALPAALRFLRLAVPPEHPGFAPWSEGCVAPGLGLGQRFPVRFSSVETSRTPKVPGRAPLCTCPARRPRRASASCLLRTLRCCLPFA